MRQQHVFVGYVGVRMEADSSDVVSPFERFFVKRLYVFENVSESKIARVQLVCGQPIKHKGVIRIRGMSNRNCPRFS
jgi:hypothetical protein